MTKTSKKSIEIVANRDYMIRFFKRHLGEFFPGAKKLTYLEAQYYTFLSSKSFLMKYELDVVIKGLTYTKFLRGNRVKRKIYLIFKNLWKWFNKSGLKTTPRPLYFFPKINFMIYEEFPGEILRNYKSDKEVLNKVLPQVAKKLALIHKFPSKVGETRTMIEEKKYLNLCLYKIRRYYLKAYKRAKKIAFNLLKFQNLILKRNSFVFTHGDFQASNIIFDPRKQNIGIIDFNMSEIFTPTNDVATFLTHLVIMINPYFSLRKINYFQRLFLENYLKNVPQKIYETVLKEFELYRARASLDITATTVVALKHTQNPYRKAIPTLLLPSALEDLKSYKNKIKKIEKREIRKLGLKDIKLMELKKL